MKLSDLVDAVAAKTGVSKADAKKNVDAVFEAVADAVVAKDSITVPGFGTFSAKDKPARTGRNPSTGAEIKIPARTAAAFKASKALNDRFGG